MGYPKAESIFCFMNVEMNRAIGRCLCAARADQSLTQIELAQRLNKPQSYVSKIEIGERNLYLSEFFAYADALGIEAEELIARIGANLP